jgi:hypothetical protein
MPKFQRFSIICLFSSFAFALCLNFQREVIEKSRFSKIYYDSGRFVDIAHELESSKPSVKEAFSNFRIPDYFVGWFIYFTKLYSHPLIYGAIVTTIVFIICFVINWQYRSNSIFVIICECAMEILLSVYFQPFGKDFWTLLVLTLPFVLFAKYKYGDFVIIGSVLLISYTIRTYFLSIIVGYLFSRWFYNKYANSLKILSCLIITSIGISLLVFIGKGETLYDFRTDFAYLSSLTDSNSMFIGSGSATTFYSLFSTYSFFPLVFETLFSLIQLFIPFKLFALGTFFHIAFALGLICFTNSIFILFSKGVRLDSISCKALSLISASFAMQCMTEYDYGSFVRHSLYLLPVFLIMYCRVTKISQLQKISSQL